jgi:transcription elongation factor GreB
MSRLPPLPLSPIISAEPPASKSARNGWQAAAGIATLGVAMSKAFTKETDAEDDELPEAQAALPAGAKNYITPAGHRRLVDELKHLTGVERPKVVETVSWAAGNGDRSENGDYIYGKKRLREIDRRIRFLVKRLEIAEIVEQRRQKNREQVFFGATVTYADGKGEVRTVRIVGIDEARLEHGEVSWVSPIARALMRTYAGDVVKLRTPAGIEEIEVVEIAYLDD